MRKVRGTKFVMNKQQNLIYAFSNNTIYQYHFPDFFLINKIAVYPNISEIILSEDEKKLAILNTEGKMAFLNLKDWLILWKDKKKHREGNLLTFTENDTKIIHADWDGQIMEFDLKTQQYDILYDFKNKPLKRFIRVSFDRYHNALVGISEYEPELYISKLSPIHFQKVNLKTFRGIFEGEDRELTLGPHYYVSLRWNGSYDHVILFNKMETLNVAQLPKNKLGMYIYISDDGEYLVVKATELLTKDLVIVYHVPDMRIVKKIYLDYVCMVKILQDNKVLLLGTWNGIFQEKLI